jgi:hypothetical protein
MTFPAAPALAEQPFRSGTALTEAQRLLDDGLIRHVVADVFVARDVPDSLQLRTSAAALLLPSRRRQEQSWVVGFESAAWVHTGWRAPAAALADVDAGEPVRARLDVIISAGRGRPLDPWIRARQAQLGGTEIMLLHGVPVSDPIRTAADIARELPSAAALCALQRLGELAQVTPGQVLNQLTTMRYARGAAKARAIITAWQES